MFPGKEGTAEVIHNFVNVICALSFGQAATTKALGEIVLTRERLIRARILYCAVLKEDAGLCIPSLQRLCPSVLS